MSPDLYGYINDRLREQAYARSVARSYPYELREIIVKVVAEQIWKEHLRRRVCWAWPA